MVLKCTINSFILKKNVTIKSTNTLEKKNTQDLKKGLTTTI